MSLLSVEQDATSLSFFSSDHQLLVCKHDRPKAGFLSEVAIPHIARYKPQRSGIAMIGLSLPSTDPTITLPVSTTSRNKSNKILSRSGLEHQGRFQHGSISYLVEVTSPHETETSVVRVTFEEILDFVTLQELERFENGQFEKELIFQDPLLANAKPKRGRPRKAALVNVGSPSSDEQEDEQSQSDIAENGIAVVIPANPRKRLHSPPQIRRRGRPRKNLLTNTPAVSPPSGGMLTVDVQNLSGSGRSPLLLKASLDADKDELIDVAFSPLPYDGEDYQDQLSNNGQDSPPQGNSKFKTSSALVAAASLSTDSEVEDDLEILHQKWAATKAGPTRPPQPSDPDTKSGTTRVSTVYQARKPGRPPKKVIATNMKRPLSAEDELSSIHRSFAASARNAIDPVVPSGLKRQEDPQESSMKPSTSHQDFGSKPRSIKPGPGNRPGYRLPSLSKTAVSTSDSESGASSQGPKQQPLRSNQHKAIVSSPILISSDDDSSESLVAASSHMQRARGSIPKPFDRSKQITLPDVKRKTTSMRSKEATREEEARISHSSQDEEDDADMLASDFPLPTIPSSQSYIAQPTTSSDTDRGERIIRQYEIAKTRRAAGSPHASDRRLSRTSRADPASALSATESIHTAQKRNQGRQSHPVRPRSHLATNLQTQNKIPVPKGHGPFIQAANESPSSSSSSDSSSTDDAAMIATIKKNPSLFDRPVIQGPYRPGKKTTSAAPKSTQTSNGRRGQLAIKGPRIELQASQARKNAANSRPFLPFTKPNTKPRPRAAGPEVPSSPPVPIPSNRQLSVSLSSPPQQRQASISFGDSSPPPPAGGREASMSLGETPSPPRRTVTPRAKPATSYTGAASGFSADNTPFRQSVSTPETAIKNGKRRLGENGEQLEQSAKKKTSVMKSMTPLYPGLPGMPVKKKRTMFGTRDD